MEPMTGDGQMNAGARAGRLWGDLMALLQLRLRQAQGDAKAAARRLVIGVVFGLLALVLLLMTLPLVVTTVILALATAMPAWLAALVVVVVLLLAAAGLLLMARARLRWPGVSLIRYLRADWQAIRQRLGEER